MVSLLLYAMIMGLAADNVACHVIGHHFSVSPEEGQMAMNGQGLVPG